MSIRERFQRGSLSALADQFKRENLYSKSGTATHVEGECFTRVLALRTPEEIKDHIDQLARRVRAADDVSLKNPDMVEAVELAKTSRDDATLQNVAAMFVHHRTVMRELAKNPHISERVQLILATDVNLKEDRETQLNLAHNVGLKPNAMMRMLQSNDEFVQLGIILTCEKQLAGPYPFGFNDVVNLLVGAYDATVRKIALKNVQDPEKLRDFSEKNSVFLMPREFEVIAQNEHTPADVLHDLANKSLPKLQPYLTIHVAEYARHNLEARRLGTQVPRQTALTME